MRNDSDYGHWSEQLTRVETCQNLPPETIDQTVERINREGYPYMDADEIIEIFSFKGMSQGLKDKYVSRFKLDK
jgi:hypothetical protein